MLLFFLVGHFIVYNIPTNLINAVYEHTRTHLFCISNNTSVGLRSEFGDKKKPVSIWPAPIVQYTFQCIIICLIIFKYVSCSQSWYEYLTQNGNQTENILIRSWKAWFILFVIWRLCKFISNVFRISL